MKDRIGQWWRSLRGIRPLGLSSTTLGAGVVVDGRFAIKRLLGFGGMSAVYVAEQKSMGRDVALKVLRSELLTHQHATDRFLREARAVSRLTNPHTISVYDVGRTEEGMLYIAMELLKGRPLIQAMMELGGPFPLWRAVNVVDQILDSLNEAHAAGVLHRDLKPENIFLVDAASGREFAKVLDFGIAQLGDEADLGAGETGVIVGTPRYMSPEQMAGRPLDARTDLYSLGTILFELLSGEAPFEAETPVELATRKLHEDPPKLADRNPAVKLPEEMDLFLARALARDPADRPPTAWEFKNLLALAVEGLVEGIAPVPAPTHPTGEMRWPTGSMRVGSPSPTGPQATAQAPAAPGPAPETASTGPRPAATTPSQAAAAVGTTPWSPRLGDRRASPRVRRMVAVRFVLDGKECRATTVDIGRGGAFLTSKDLPAVGQRLEIQIAAPDKSVAVAPRLGEVVRVVEQPSHTGDIRGFAVKWIQAGGARTETAGAPTPVSVDDLIATLR